MQRGGGAGERGSGGAEEQRSRGAEERGSRGARENNYQLSIINYQLSIINYQLSIINYQLSIINFVMMIRSKKFELSGFFIIYGKLDPRLCGDIHGKKVKRLSVILLFIYLIIAGSSAKPSNAQIATWETLREPPLDLRFLELGIPTESEDVITANNIAESGLTIPSLWWVKEQFAGKLLDNWLAYPNDNQIGGRVDLVVNRQVWSLLDYLQRYEFVNHFGTAAKEQQYNTRVFNRQGGLLAAYTCEFNVEPLGCKIWLDSSGFQGTRQPFSP